MRCRFHLYLAWCGVVLSYSAAAAESPPTAEWARLWNSPANHDDMGELVTVDPAGLIYTAGSSYIPSDVGEDFFLLCHDVDGNLLWFRTWGGAGNDHASGLENAGPGEVVLCGYSWDDGQPSLAVVKFDDTGTVVWERLHELDGVFWGSPPVMTVDAQLNILVAAGEGGDYRVVKFSGDGILLWSQSYDTDNHDFDVPTGITTDGAGAVYVTGWTGSPSAFVTVKFSSSGSFLWDQSEPGDIGSVFSPSRVAITPDGDVVVSGSTESVCGTFQARTWKLTPDTGVVSWIQIFPPDPCWSVHVRDLAVDSAGNTVVIGFGAIESSDGHFQTLKYNPDGTLLWHQAFDGPGDSTDEPAALEIDGAGNVYVAGYSTFTPQNRDFAGVKYSPAGQELWSLHWSGPFGTNDSARDIALHPLGDLVVTGSAYDPAHQEEAVTIYFHQDNPASVSPKGRSGQGASLSAARVVPVPASLSAGTLPAIHFRLETSGPVRLRIHDVGGDLVRTLAIPFCAQGENRVVWDRENGQGRPVGPGVYFFTLESGATSTTGRISLTR